MAKAQGAGLLLLLGFICPFLPHPDKNTHIYCLSTFKHRIADGEKANPSGKICYTDVISGGLLFWIQLLLLFPVASSSLLILYLSMTFSHLIICLFLIFFFHSLSFSTSLCVAAWTNGIEYFGLNVLNRFVYSGTFYGISILKE